MPSILEDPVLEEHIPDSEEIQNDLNFERRHEEEKRAACFINISNKLNQELFK